jgi:hypothetical protein
VQAVVQHVDGAVRAPAQEPPGAAVLEEVGPPVLEVEPAGGVGEVDGAVRRDGRVVAHAQVGGVHEHLDLPGRAVDEQQAPVGVADHQAPVGVQLQAERAAAGVGDRVEPAAVRGEAQDAAVVDAGEHVALVDHDVLGAVAVDVQHGERGQRVLCRPSLYLGRPPDDGIDRGTAHVPSLHPSVTGGKPPHR